MIATIDAAGRVVIPKAFRDGLGLTGGEELEISVRDGTILIEPKPVPVTLVETPDGPVAVPDRTLPPLTDDIVRDTLEHVRR
ncbi:MAG: AbrB/MazE/SpoVT family DNA-binding domain-containing protein [Acidimicrobiia bacterium]|nr:MAG: AbrB/MazE/SpoVT family DNA-binding domain-containing protein [Acidimicrobiia bacterium]